MKLITKQTYLVYWRHAMRYRAAFWIVAGSIALGSLIPIITALYYKRFFDVLAGGLGNPEAVTGTLVGIVLTVLLLNGVTWVAYRVATFVNNFFQPRVIADLTNSSFEYLHQHSYGFFINRFVGGLVRKVGRLTRAFEEISDAVYWNLLPMAVRIVAVLVVIFAHYPSLGYILLGWIVLYLGINYGLTLKKLKLDEAAAAADTRVTAYLADTITNQANLKVFTAEHYEEEGFRKHTHEQFRLAKKSWDFDAVIESVQAGFMFVLEFVMFYMAIKLWQQGKVSVGDFVLIQIYLVQLFDQLWGFGRVIRRMYRNLADAEEMVQILHTPHQVQDVPRATSLVVKHGEVEFRNVSFTYADARQIIRNFNLCVAAGEKVGLVGPSGAGKSTLAALVLRFFDLPEGVIYIDGQNIAEVTQESLRRQVSLVPQDPVLFHRSLMDNIRYGRREATEEEVQAAAKLAHCDEFIERLPQRYETYVGERGIKLSGGERQRVAIARAILKNAPILVLDEATSSLDSHTEAVIQDALSNLMREKTTIVIAHRLSTIMKMDRIIVVRDGAIHEIGTHAELLQKQGGLYQKLWELQAGGFLRA
ncbi:MAG: ABC transporter ATP-binding protein, partial [Candidatus Veblenbacteria bacterium]|nr:ABC transporter ATP-binding protein [Candidatus Veblenbacteria bacterium]MDZ4229732.1 ABC transporter ATP-binding protein [Candidatus Veblenbacteria bacterium]